MPAADPVDVEVTELSGGTFPATLVELSAGEAVFQTEEGQRAMDTAKLSSVAVRGGADEDVETTPDVLVELVDGSQLHAKDFLVQRGRATIQVPEGDELRASTKSVHSVRFKRQDAAVQKQWQEIVTSRRSGDAIVIRKTSEPAEEEAPAVVLDHLEGVLHEIGPDTIGFEFDDSMVDVPRAKVEGIIYYSSRSSALPDPVAVVVDRRGARWNAKSMKLGDDRLELVSAAGVRCALPLDQLAEIDFSAANLVYLSDLEPTSEEWHPRVYSGATPQSVSRWFRPKRDHVMELGGETYEKGLSLHSRTQLTYRLRRDYRRFLALVGIDDRYRNEGTVFLKISGDGQVLFEDLVRGGDAPQKLDLDLRGVRRLTILVDFGDESDHGDHLNFCNARLTK